VAPCRCPRNDLIAVHVSLHYRRLASPLHVTRAGVGALWIASLCAASLLLYHPLALLVLLLAVLGAGAGARLGRPLARSLRLATIVWLPIVLVNVLVSREGLTVFARLGDLGPFGQGDLTVEAVVYGAVIALKVVLLIVVTTLASLAVDPDEALRIVRRLSFRSALTASLATRMVPLLAADAQRLAEAQRTRPAGRGGGRVTLVRAIVGSSLDRALDVASTLELRGFATARRAPRAPRAWSRHDLAFLASAGAVIGLALLGRLTGAGRFEAYPEVHAASGPATLVLAAALAVAVLAPFADRRGIER
jgi:energy-coupling factor transport system permease protein